MKIVIFGLSVSSSWGNGHATLWRGLCSALHGMGHRVVFFERDVPYYASHRDLHELHGGELVLYRDWSDAAARAQIHLSEGDAAMVTSFCPDGVAASELILASPVPLRVFYDLDTPVTLAKLDAGEELSWIGPRGLRDFDLVLSYTGGRALDELQQRLGARAVAPLYGSVDPEVHRPADAMPEFACDLSYLGTYAEDRQSGVERLLIEPARRVPGFRFLIGGSMYPEAFPWAENIFFVRHIPPFLHAAFYSSSRLTLNVTRQAMADMGWCPSGRLFEAAACGVPIVSDWWEGLDHFYTPGSEIVLCHSADDVVSALREPDERLRAIAARASERTLDCHTAGNRARELVRLLEGAAVCGESSPRQEKEAAFNH
ncbi:MAG TPA: glycosyltransferase [Bryobacteraceae bacterium]|nr:glycosyltransferase [Bryobacteraceae bacterium]